MYGELVPVGDGEPIPLLKTRIRVGRREGCDIILNYANISGHHCLLENEDGYWFVRDLNSRNGVKIDGKRINSNMRRRLDPNCEVTIGKRKFEINYNPGELGALGPPPQDDQIDTLPPGSLLN